MLQRRECTALVAATTRAIPTDQSEESEPLRAAAKVYRAAGEVCLGRLTAASRDVQVDVAASNWTDCTGQPELLQRWVRLMISAVRGDSNARRSLGALPKVSYACVTPPPEQPEPSTS
jgi:hypothetical protein